jgi:hypothetical protein
MLTGFRSIAVITQPASTCVILLWRNYQDLTAKEIKLRGGRYGKSDWQRTGPLLQVV